MLSILALALLEAIHDMLQSACESQSLLSIKFFNCPGNDVEGVVNQKGTSGICQFDLSRAPSGTPFDIGHITFCHEGTDCAGYRTNRDPLKSSKSAGGPLRGLGRSKVAQRRPLGRKQIRCKSK